MAEGCLSGGGEGEGEVIGGSCCWVGASFVHCMRWNMKQRVTK